jgi:predicted DNA-binding transcriptional regulator YafY
MALKKETERTLNRIIYIYILVSRDNYTLLSRHDNLREATRTYKGQRVQISRYTNNNNNTTALLVITRNDEPQEVTTEDRAVKIES